LTIQLVPIEGSLPCNDATPHCDHRRVGSIVGAEFRKNVPHVGFHRFFGDAELDSDFLIGFAGSDLFQDVHFAVRKFILADVLGDLQGDLRWNSL
jgi:hypothetical protein